MNLKYHNNKTKIDETWANKQTPTNSQQYVKHKIKREIPRRTEGNWKRKTKRRKRQTLDYINDMFPSFQTLDQQTNT